MRRAREGGGGGGEKAHTTRPAPRRARRPQRRRGARRAPAVGQGQVAAAVEVAAQQHQRNPGQRGQQRGQARKPQQALPQRRGLRLERREHGRRAVRRAQHAQLLEQRLRARHREVVVKPGRRGRQIGHGGARVRRVSRIALLDAQPTVGHETQVWKRRHLCAAAARQGEEKRAGNTRFYAKILLYLFDFHPFPWIPASAQDDAAVVRAKERVRLLVPAATDAFSAVREPLRVCITGARARSLPT